MPYKSAHDLPSFVEISQQLKAFGWLRFLIPKDKRPNVKELKEQLRLIGDTVDRFYAVLGSRHWIFHDSMPLQRMADLLDASADAAEAERSLVDYYKDAANLDFLVRGLYGFEALRRRRHLIQRAYDDYFAERYYATIHVLLSVMDGFVNEFETVRRGLHAREAEELDALDSIAGHHMGLMNAHKTFTKSKGATSSDLVAELYRNGIVHGTLIDYDNDTVATKAWNRLFAVVDWAKAREKEKRPPKPQPTWRELLAQLADNEKKKRANEAWRPEALRPGDEGFDEHPAFVASEQFLAYWRQRNYGRIAEMLSNIVRSAYGTGMPREVRNEYTPYNLAAYEIVGVDHSAPAVCMTDVKLTFDTGDERLGRLRWIYEDETGDAVASSLPGAWRLIVWGPAAFLSPDRASS